MAYNNAQIFLAELVGTFIFIAIGNGSICNALLPGTKGHGMGYLGIAMSFGLALFVSLQIVGHISGFFNPAVALGAAVTGLISWRRFGVTVAAELIGSFLAALLLYLMYIPHFQPLALVDQYGEDEGFKSGENPPVAVIKQEVKGSARRYASHGNKRTHTGIKLQHEKENWHIFTNFFSTIWEAMKDLEKGKGTKKVVSSTNLQKVQVDHRSTVKSTIEHSIEVDQEIKLVVFCTRPSSEKLYWIFAPLAEMVGTAFLTYGAFAIDDRVKYFVANENEHLFFSAMQAFLIALLLIGIIVSCGGITGPALNPVKDFTPRLVHWLMPIPGKGSSEWWYAWVPIVGPCIGGVIGALFSEQMKRVTEANSG